MRRNGGYTRIATIGARKGDVATEVFKGLVSVQEKEMHLRVQFFFLCVARQMSFFVKGKWLTIVRGGYTEDEIGCTLFYIIKKLN